MVGAWTQGLADVIEESEGTYTIGLEDLLEQNHKLSAETPLGKRVFNW